MELGQEGFVHFSNLPVITYVTSRIIWHDLLCGTPLLRRRLQGLFGQSFQLEARSEIGVWGATEQLWNAFHNCSVAPQTPNIMSASHRDS